MPIRMGTKIENSVCFHGAGVTMQNMSFNVKSNTLIDCKKSYSNQIAVGSARAFDQGLLHVAGIRAGNVGLGRVESVLPAQVPRFLDFSIPADCN
jgi:hypothetical protein